MFNNLKLNLHRIAHAVLAGVYGAMTIIMALEHALAHATCTAVAMLVYAVLARK